MNWYKKATSQNFNTWLSEQINTLSNNFKKDISHYDKDINKIEEWVKDTNPDLSNLTFEEAKSEALNHQYRIYKEWSPEELTRNKNRFRFESQRLNPEAPNFAVDTRDDSTSIPQKSKKKINNALHDLGNYHKQIPLQKIFDILRNEDVVAIQEDGTLWSGLLLGGGECGSEKAKDQRTIFHLATKRSDGEYVPANSVITLNWCVMPSGNYEIVCYLS